MLISSTMLVISACSYNENIQQHVDDVSSIRLVLLDPVERCRPLIVVQLAVELCNLRRPVGVVEVHDVRIAFPNPDRQLGR